MEKRLDMKKTNAQTVMWTDLCDELGAGPEGERVRAHGGELLERGAEALHERALAPRRERADERERKDLEDGPLEEEKRDNTRSVATVGWNAQRAEMQNGEGRETWRLNAVTTLMACTASESTSPERSSSLVDA
jgi:hypothetical protein